ncbi:hypothetical protein LINPERPRIM_LOCUS25275 [Linum perenne]
MLLFFLSCSHSSPFPYSNLSLLYFINFAISVMAWSLPRVADQGFENDFLNQSLNIMESTFEKMSKPKKVIKH